MSEQKLFYQTIAPSIQLALADLYAALAMTNDMPKAFEVFFGKLRIIEFLIRQNSIPESEFDKLQKSIKELSDEYTIRTRMFKYGVTTEFQEMINQIELRKK